VPEGRHLKGLHWGPLPGTRQEARELESLFRRANIPTTVKCGPDANKEALLGARAPQFLHVATHGFFIDDRSMANDADPFTFQVRYLGGRPVPPADPWLYSGLALAGANAPDGVRTGLVTAYEMKWMDLQGTELVTLSACETGLGAATTGGGVRGLQQSLLQCGARRVVSSLWKVPDLETARLMSSFYRRLLSHEPTSSALRNAMMEIRVERMEANGGAAHPYFWGAFVLIGDPGAVATRAGAR
jgi:CHAT domain-containing protein